MNSISIKDLYQWCKIPAESLANHPQLKMPFRLTSNSEEMGEVMARDFADECGIVAVDTIIFQRPRFTIIC